MRDTPNTLYSGQLSTQKQSGISVSPTRRRCCIPQRPTSRPTRHTGETDHVQHLQRPRARSTSLFSRAHSRARPPFATAARGRRMPRRTNESRRRGRPSRSRAKASPTPRWPPSISRRSRPRSRSRQLRFRKLTIEPGGVVPWHSHSDRPAIIYIAEGEIHEYASNCAAPIVHKAGDIRPETAWRRALVEEPRRQDRGAVRRRRAARQDRQAHVSGPRRALERDASPARDARRHLSPANRRHRTMSQAADTALMEAHRHPPAAPAPHARHRRHRLSHARRPVRDPGDPAVADQAYGVTPAAMGLAVNASTLGMAVAGLARGAVQPAHRSPARASC